MSANAAAAPTVPSSPAAVSAAGGNTRSLRWLWSGALLVLLAFLVIYPVAMLLIGAFTTHNPVVDGVSLDDFSVGNFTAVLE